MASQRIPKDRLQAMLYAAHARAQQEDCVHRLEIRAEVSKLIPERERILRSWGGDWA